MCFPNNSILQWWVTPKLPKEYIYLPSQKRPKSIVKLISKVSRIWFFHPLKRRVARYWLKYLKKFHGLKVVGITGSVGKTTTKQMISSILLQDGETVSTYKNEDPVYNIPTTILKCRASTKYLVLEMGIEFLGEMNYYLWLAQPDVGVLAKVGWVHAEFLGGIDNVFEEKANLIKSLKKHDTAILNISDSKVDKLAKEIKCKKITFAIDKGADLVPSNLSYDNNFNTQFVLAHGGESVKIRLPVLGKHFIESALASVAVGLSYGLTLNKIKRGLESFISESHRMRPILTKEKVLVIDDTYNANPLSVKAAIDVLVDVGKRNRKILVIGDMKELGSYERKGHEKIGRYATEKGVDVIVTLGGLARIVGNEATKTGIDEGSVYITNDKEEIISVLKKLVSKNDAVLIKGSRSMQMESVVDELT